MGKINAKMLDDKFISELNRILKNGDVIELKKENNHLVLVEIQRKVKQKATMIG